MATDEERKASILRQCGATGNADATSELNLAWDDTATVANNYLRNLLVKKAVLTYLTGPEWKKTKVTIGKDSFDDGQRFTHLMTLLNAVNAEIDSIKNPAGKVSRLGSSKAKSTMPGCGGVGVWTQDK